MKTLTKLTTIAAAIAAILGTGTAFAGNEPFQNILALERARTQKNQPTTTIAFYAKGTGIGTRKEAARNEGRWVRHENGRGTYFLYHPAR